MRLAYLRGGTYLRFGDLQVPHLNTGSGEVGDLELDIDRPLGRAHGTSSAHTSTKATRHTTAVLVVSLDRGKTQLRPHKELLATTELLDLPDNRRLFGGIVNSSYISAETRRVCIFWDGDENLNVVCSTAALELGLGLYRGM